MIDAIGTESAAILYGHWNGSCAKDEEYGEKSEGCVEDARSAYPEGSREDSVDAPEGSIAKDEPLRAYADSSQSYGILTNAPGAQGLG